MHETTLEPQKQSCPFHHEHGDPEWDLAAEVDHVAQRGPPRLTNLHNLRPAACLESVDDVLPPLERPRPQIAEPGFAAIRLDDDVIASDAVCTTGRNGFCNLFVGKVGLSGFPKDILLKQ